MESTHTLTDLPVQLTPGALEEIRRLMDQPGFTPGAFLRIGVKGGGCAGMSYILDFGLAELQDEQFEIEGIGVIMNPAHAMYLKGMEIDFQHGLNARGFTFTNPNAGTTCGCGSSFSV